ncbi:MAG: hypothetical protein ACP5RD_04310 [bacterium]|jgi:Zn ribbon nucleic-acid-binding protein
MDNKKKDKKNKDNKNNNINDIFEDIIKESIADFNELEGDILEGVKCPKCKGIIYEDIDIEDLFLEEEKEVKEFACLICGYRFYVDVAYLKTKININKQKYN